MSTQSCHGKCPESLGKPGLSARPSSASAPARGVDVPVCVPCQEAGGNQESGTGFAIRKSETALLIHMGML